MELKEAIAHIQDTTATYTRIEKQSGLRDARSILHPNGSVEYKNFPPPDRVICMHDTQSLSALLDSDFVNDPAVFVSPAMAVVVFNTDFREYAVLKFLQTPEFRAMSGWYPCPVNHSVDGLRDMLLYELFEAAPAGLIAMVGGLDVLTKESSTQSLARDTESMGEFVYRQLDAVSTPPPDREQKFLVKAFHIDECPRLAVRVFVDPDLSSRSWKVAVSEADWVDMLTRSVEAIRTAIVGERSVPSFDGVPWLPSPQERLGPEDWRVGDIGRPANRHDCGND